MIQRITVIVIIYIDIWLIDIKLQNVLKTKQTQNWITWQVQAMQKNKNAPQDSQWIGSWTVYLYRSSIDFIGESPIKMSDTDERSAVGFIYFKVYIKYSIFQNEYNNNITKMKTCIILIGRTKLWQLIIT